jgi:hypothetical protein
MKYVIICPFAVRTGGPEACFQLADSLNRQGFTAEMWMLSESDISDFIDAKNKQIILTNNSLKFPKRENLILEYKHYECKYFESYEPGEDVLFIIPELFIWMLPLFIGSKIMVWWLSVDNSFKALANINLNMLRMPLVKHAVQSEYAKNFTMSLGLESVNLTDYTVVPQNTNAKIEDRNTKISINAGPKVILNLERLFELILTKKPDVQLLPINGMSREQVYDAFNTSRLFIDLGCFPGKDRMPREALLLGANIIVGSSGSGSFEEDFPISKMYRPNPFDLDLVSSLAVHMVNYPLVHAKQFNNARQIFVNEQENFDKEVLYAFSLNI